MHSDAEYAIEAWCGREVEHVDARRRMLRCTDGSSLSYDMLLLATGGTLRTLDVPGAELENVFSLRSLDDANRMDRHLKGRAPCHSGWGQLHWHGGSCKPD